MSLYFICICNLMMTFFVETGSNHTYTTTFLFSFFFTRWLFGTFKYLYTYRLRGVLRRQDISTSLNLIHDFFQNVYTFYYYFFLRRPTNSKYQTHTSHFWHRHHIAISFRCFSYILSLFSLIVHKTMEMKSSFLYVYD